MENVFKIVMVILLLFSLCAYNISEGIPVPHTIRLNHPGISLTETVERTLFEIKDARGHAKEFYMNVETVVCGDSQCRIDTVRIYWNTLGFYDHLILPAGVALEKAEGKPFNHEDLGKLSSILSDKNSSLKNVYKEEVVGTESSDGVDGLTGATIILNTNDFVEGAVWTCYTLWHWANGDIFSIIRNQTGAHLTSNDLIDSLKKENPETQLFALEQIIRRKFYEPEVIEIIQKNAPSNDYQLTKLSIEYFEKASLGIYYKTMENLLKGDKPKQRLLYLHSILKNKNHPPEGYYKSLSLQLSTWNDYPSINLFLKLLENKNACTPAIIQSVFQLLDNKNFIIARRVYWFLKAQKLSKQEEDNLDKFYTKYADSL